ncbi:PREDICTED: uncharacterized protein LOC109148629 isoform X2 [Ipomoea nil]|uniref:uncharacterized protein LOC109148629 isoform X2 n=1 Tax=Ipomoea nil TaxID=35883 RepID=UPI0009015BB0|nr:PREDICTED: uncharacterized protein LOC109148629 isoform X2 [Ipomoea nil]
MLNLQENVFFLIVNAFPACYMHLHHFRPLSIFMKMLSELWRNREVNNTRFEGRPKIIKSHSMDITWNTRNHTADQLVSNEISSSLSTMAFVVQTGEMVNL